MEDFLAVIRVFLCSRAFFIIRAPLHPGQPKVYSNHLSNRMIHCYTPKTHCHDPKRTTNHQYSTEKYMPHHAITAPWSFWMNWRSSKGTPSSKQVEVAAATLRKPSKLHLVTIRSKPKNPPLGGAKKSSFA